MVTSEARKPRAASPPSLRTANNFKLPLWEGEVRSSFRADPRQCSPPRMRTPKKFVEASLEIGNAV